jgi:hypothetical protein
MSSKNEVDYVYRYGYASEMIAGTDGSRLQIATSQLGDTYPYFFEGRLLQPRTTATLLGVVPKLVGTRFYIPPAMLQRILDLADPVVTSGGGLLRFEGFSACCSAYIRVDVTPEAYAGKVVGHGTTNVDFNAGMRAALARTRDDDRVSVSVGPDEVMLRHGFQSVVERKVKLPARWLKGFVEVQSYQSAMQLRLRTNKIETLRFLRSLPANANNRSNFWVVPSANGLRLSQIKTADGVCVTGLTRLLILQKLAPLADELRVYAHPSGESSEWQLICGGNSVSLTITADVSRGFSGEGQVLTNLTASESKISEIQAALKWHAVVDINEVARTVQLDPTEVRKTLSFLGSRGLVGYDCSSNSYFHRELPFDLSAVESMHPRLKNAAKIVDSENVIIIREDAQLIEAEVTGSDVAHRVRLAGEVATCTCQWFAKYQGTRGPCKHVLAVQIIANRRSSDLTPH